MPSKDLASLGWDEFFEKQFSALSHADWVPARVVGEERGLYRLVLPGDATYWGELPGKWFHGAESRLDLPATGDWVACEPRAATGRATIHHLFERRSCLVRKAAGETREEQILAANVNTVFILTSLNQDLNLRRLERYLALAWDGGASPVILLTKADLSDRAEAARREVEAVAPGVPIHVISSKKGMGLEALTPYLQPGRTSVLLGSSGVGKSTLANKLLGRDLLRTQEIREEDDKGRHTTTSRYLLRLDDGSMLIDTPGIRELQLLDHEEGLETLFSDIEQLARGCRFNDCRHEKEPDCAVKTALAGGTLTRARLESYHKLRREVEFEERKHDKGAQSRERARWRSVHRSLRSHLKQKRNPKK